MRIGVIAGGESSEREVSLKSGRAVFEALKGKGYNVLFIDADRTLPEKLINEPVDVAFLVLHGGWGEDGSIQGMLEVMGIPYTGSGVLASAAAMDKVVSKRLFQSEGLSVPPYTVVDAEGGFSVPEFGPPWVVKPRREGSSVGVSIVDDRDSLADAIEEASRYGRWVILEEYISAREVHIGILGDRVLGGVEVRPRRRFYDYRAKYTPGETDYILPPELEPETYERVKEVAFRAHRALDCAGATRVDLLVTADEVYVLEVNTIPGMTETSLLPKIARQAGYEFGDFIEEILKDAIRRHEEKRHK